MKVRIRDLSAGDIITTPRNNGKKVQSVEVTDRYTAIVSFADGSDDMYGPNQKTEVSR